MRVYAFFLVMCMPFLSGETSKIEKRRLSILFVVHSFPTAAFVINQLTGLIDRGHDVMVLAGKQGTTPSLALASYDLTGKVYYGDIPKNKNSFDIILCQFATIAPLCMDLIRRGAQGKFVVCFRGGSIFKREALLHDILVASDLLLPVCDYFEKKLIFSDAEVKKIKKVHSSIDCSKFAFKRRIPAKDDTIRIVTTARLVREKGHEYAIDAVAKLLKKYPKIEYDILGAGELFDQLQERIKKLDVGDNIRLLGYKTQEEVARILESAHLFVLASISNEGIPNALKEAMAMGLPVVSTYHAGIPELVKDGVSGFLVPERNVDALAEKIEYLIGNPELWPAMGQMGRKKVEQEFELNTENDKLEKILLDLVDTK